MPSARFTRSLSALADQASSVAAGGLLLVGRLLRAVDAAGAAKRPFPFSPALSPTWRHGRRKLEATNQRCRQDYRGRSGRQRTPSNDEHFGFPWRRGDIARSSLTLRALAIGLVGVGLHEDKNAAVDSARSRARNCSSGGTAGCCAARSSSASRCSFKLWSGLVIARVPRCPRNRRKSFSQNSSRKACLALASFERTATGVDCSAAANCSTLSPSTYLATSRVS